MQNVNKLQRDEQSIAELRKKTMFGAIHRMEDNRLILFDSMQPLRNGHHLQSTNSIFRQNKDIVSKKQFM